MSKYKSEFCKRGLHLLNDQSTIIKSNGFRECRACRNARIQARRRIKGRKQEIERRRIKRQEDRRVHRLANI